MDRHKFYHFVKRLSKVSDSGSFGVFHTPVDFVEVISNICLLLINWILEFIEQ